MNDYFEVLRQIIDPWWNFLFSTYVPRMNFTFGELFVTLLFLSFFTFLLRLALFHKNKEA